MSEREPAVEESTKPPFAILLVDNGLQEEHISSTDLVAGISADLKLPDPKKSKKKKKTLKSGPPPVPPDSIANCKIVCMSRAELDLPNRSAPEFEAAKVFDEEKLGQLHEKINQILDSLQVDLDPESPTPHSPNTSIHIVLIDMFDVLEDVIDVQNTIGNIRAHIALESVPIIVAAKKKKSKKDDPPPPPEETPVNPNVEIGLKIQAGIENCADPVMENVICTQMQLFEDASKKKGKPKFKVLGEEKLNHLFRTWMKEMDDSVKSYASWRDGVPVFEFVRSSNDPAPRSKYMECVSWSADDSSIVSVVRGLVRQVEQDFGELLEETVNDDSQIATAVESADVCKGDILSKYLAREDDQLLEVEVVLIDLDDDMKARHAINGLTDRQLEEQSKVFSNWCAPAVESLFESHPRQPGPLQRVENTERYTFTQLEDARFDHALICEEFRKMMMLFGLHTDEDEKISNRNWNILQRRYLEELSSNSMRMRLFEVLSHPMVEILSKHISWMDSVLLVAHVHTPQLRRRVFEENCFLYPHVGYRYWRSLPQHIRQKPPQLLYSHADCDLGHFLDKRLTAFYPSDKTVFGLSSTPSGKPSLWILDEDIHARVDPAENSFNTFSCQFGDGTRVAAKWTGMEPVVVVDSDLPHGPSQSGDDAEAAEAATENADEKPQEEEQTEQESDSKRDESAPVGPSSPEQDCEGLIVTTLPNGTMIEYHLRTRKLFIYSDHDRVAAFLEHRSNRLRQEDAQRRAAIEAAAKAKADAEANAEENEANAVPPEDNEKVEEDDGNDEKEDGDQTARQEIDEPILESPVEIWRCFDSNGVVDLQFSNGSVVRYHCDSSVWTRKDEKDPWRKVDENGRIETQSGVPTDSDKIEAVLVTDPESRTQITTREDFVMQFRADAGDRSIEFADRTRVFTTCQRRWMEWDRHLLRRWMESVGVTVESALLFANDLQTNGEEFWGLVHKLPTIIRDDADLPVLLRGVDALRNEVKDILIEHCNYPSVGVNRLSGEMSVIVHEDFVIKFQPDGARVCKTTTDSTTQVAIQLTQDAQQAVVQPLACNVEIPNDWTQAVPKGLYRLDLMEGSIVMEDLEENQFEARLDGRCESSLFVERSIADDVEKKEPASEVNDDTATEVVDAKIPLKYFAPPRDPIEPRLFVVRRDGSGYEILHDQEFEKFSRFIDGHADGTVVGAQPAVMNKEFPLSHQFLLRLKEAAPSRRELPIPNVMRASLEKARVCGNCVDEDRMDKKVNLIRYRNIFEIERLTEQDVETAIADMAKCEAWRAEVAAKDEHFEVEQEQPAENPQLSKLRQALFQQRETRLQDRQDVTRARTTTFFVQNENTDSNSQTQREPSSEQDKNSSPTKKRPSTDVSPRRSKFDEQLDQERHPETDMAYFANPAFSRNFVIKELLGKVFLPLCGDENLQYDDEATQSFSSRLILFRKLGARIRHVCSDKTEKPEERCLYEKEAVLQDLFILPDVKEIITNLLNVLGFAFEEETGIYHPIRTRMYLEGGAAEVDAAIDECHARFKRKIREKLNQTTHGHQPTSSLNVEQMYGTGSQYFPHPNSSFILQSGAIDIPVSTHVEQFSHPERETVSTSSSMQRFKETSVEMSNSMSIRDCPQCKKSLCSCCERDEHDRAKFVSAEGDDRPISVDVQRDVEVFQPSAPFQYDVDRIELEAATQSRLKTASTYATSLFPESGFGAIKITPQRIDFGKVVIGAAYRFCATIVNVGNYSARFRVETPPTDPQEDIHVDVFFRPGALAPGMTSPLEVELKMNVAPAYVLVTELVVKTQLLVFTIPVLAEATDDMRFLNPTSKLCQLSEAPAVPEE